MSDGSSRLTSLAVGSLGSDALAGSRSTTLAVSKGLSARASRSVALDISGVKLNVQSFTGGQVAWCPAGAPENYGGAVAWPAAKDRVSRSLEPRRSSASAAADARERSEGPRRPGTSDGVLCTPRQDGSATGRRLQKREKELCFKIGSYHLQDGDAGKRQSSNIPSMMSCKVPSSIPDRGGRLGLWARLGGAEDTAVRSEKGGPLILSVPVAGPSAASSEEVPFLDDPLPSKRPPWQRGEFGKKSLGQQKPRGEQPTIRRAQHQAPGAVLAAVASARSKAAGPVQVAVVKPDGELELQSVSSEMKADLSPDGHKMRVRDRKALERIKELEKAQKVHHVRYHKKKAKAGVGCLSKLLLQEQRSGNLIKTPPREAFFQAW